jgi:hypothetical protein
MRLAVGCGVWGGSSFAVVRRYPPLPATANYRSHRAEHHVNHAFTIRVYLFISTNMTLPERHISAGPVGFLAYPPGKSFRPCPAGFLRSDVSEGAIKLTKIVESGPALQCYSIGFDKEDGLVEGGKRRDCRRFVFILRRQIRRGDFDKMEIRPGNVS